MRPWLLGLCVGFALVTPLAKQVLASTYVPNAYYAEGMVYEESMPADIESIQLEDNSSEMAEPTSAD